MACLRDTLGTNTVFHCRNGAGYSSDVDKAHAYTLDEAQRAWNSGREFDLPLNADLVDSLTVNHVDCQRIPRESVVNTDKPGHVAYVAGKWDGNDVYWLSDNSLPTTDFNLAAIRDFAGSGDGLIWIPFDVANAAKRRTFSVGLINRRKMTQASGLKMPEHIKRTRRRNHSGKTRWNCPGCGQISWQHNPYDFDGCRNINCEEWSA